MNKWLSLVKIVAPLVVAAVPGGEKVAPFLPVLIQGIADAEQLAGAVGAEKKTHVIALVQDGVAAANLAKPNSVDEIDTIATASHVIDAVVGVTNLVARTKVQ